MGRIYAVTFSGTITNSGGDTDLLEITPADDKPVKIRGWSIGQTSEIKDAEEEGLRCSIILLPSTFTSGSGGSSATPRPADSADAAAGATCEVNNTTVGTTSGTAVTLAEFSWINRNSPWDFFYPDDRFCPKVKGADGLVFRLQTTVADDMSANYTFWIEEE